MKKVLCKQCFDKSNAVDKYLKMVQGQYLNDTKEFSEIKCSRCEKLINNEGDIRCYQVGKNNKIQD